MTTRRGWAAALAAAGLVAVLGGCGSDDAATSTPAGEGTDRAADTLDCAALLPDDALTALGWSPGAPAEEHAGRCQRRVDEVGQVTVATRAEGQEGFTSTCDELRSGGDYVAQPVTWLDPATEESCATGLADDTHTGVAELYFVNDTGELVQVRVEALAPLQQEQLQAGLNELVAAAATMA